MAIACSLMVNLTLKVHPQSQKAKKFLPWPKGPEGSHLVFGKGKLLAQPGVGLARWWFGRTPTDGLRLANSRFKRGGFWVGRQINDCISLKQFWVFFPSAVLHGICGIGLEVRSSSAVTRRNAPWTTERCQVCSQKAWLYRNVDRFFIWGISTQTRFMYLEPWGEYFNNFFQK